MSNIASLYSLYIKKFDPGDYQIMKKVLFLLSIATISLISTSSNTISREFVDKVALVVNDDIITLSEFKVESKRLGLNLENSEDESKALEQIIDITLIEQEAKKIGITVSDEELELTLKEFKKQYNLKEKEMKKKLNNQNFSQENFKEQLRFQLLTKKLIDAKLKGKIAVTDEEILDFYKENFGESGGGGNEVRIAHILISSDSSESQQKANEIANKAKSGENFSELAKEYSDDQLSANIGGDLGFFKKGDLVESLEIAVQNAEVNEVVGPVESPAGYHIIIVLDRKDSKSGIPESYKLEIKNALYNKKAEELLKSWLNNIKETAYIERKI